MNKSLIYKYILVQEKISGALLPNFTITDLQLLFLILKKSLVVFYLKLLLQKQNYCNRKQKVMHLHFTSQIL